jgi:two-component system sensor kinase FixL
MQATIDKKTSSHEPDVAQSWRLACVSEIVALMAHRLAQPMTAINAYAAATLKNARGPAPDFMKLADNLEKIEQQARRATDMIHAFAAFSHRREPASAVDVTAAIDAALALLAADARQHDVEIAVDHSVNVPRVAADRTTVEQVTACLVRNAIDALARCPGGTRRIEIATHRAADGMVEVEVADTGPGIDETVEAGLFDPFAPSRPEDCGVGLTVSRALLEMYGGRIGVTSSGRSGTVVVFALPSAKA